MLDARCKSCSRVSVILNIDAKALHIALRVTISKSYMSHCILRLEFVSSCAQYSTRLHSGVRVWVLNGTLWHTPRAQGSLRVCFQPETNENLRNRRRRRLSGARALACIGAGQNITTHCLHARNGKSTVMHCGTLTAALGQPTFSPSHHLHLIAIFLPLAFPFPFFFTFCP